MPVTILPEGFVFPQGKDSDSVWSATIDDRYLDLFDLALSPGATSPGPIGATRRTSPW